MFKQCIQPWASSCIRPTEDTIITRGKSSIVLQPLAMPALLLGKWMEVFQKTLVCSPLQSVSVDQPHSATLTSRESPRQYPPLCVSSAFLKPLLVLLRPSHLTEDLSAVGCHGAWEADTGGLWGQNQPKLPRETLFQKMTAKTKSGKIPVFFLSFYH